MKRTKRTKAGVVSVSRTQAGWVGRANGRTIRASTQGALLGGFSSHLSASDLPPWAQRALLAALKALVAQLLKEWLPGKGKQKKSTTKKKAVKKSTRKKKSSRSSSRSSRRRPPWWR